MSRSKSAAGAVLSRDRGGRSGGRLDPASRLPGEWESALAQIGERSFRARQVFRWIHAHGVYDAQLMTNLPNSLREYLANEGLKPPASVAQVHGSRDGTRKLVLQLDDAARVECVLMRSSESEEDPEEAGGVNDPLARTTEDGRARRVTLCVSTQVGCAMGCRFCASGQAGLIRGLHAAEIVGQVVLARRCLRPGEQLRNLVFMGMGEPLQHYESTARALRLIQHATGLAIGPRRITVSTVGLVPGIRRLGEDFGGRIGLAVSLHAPDDATRNRLVPINARFPIAELLGALQQYPLPRRRRITIEYTLVKGVNDSLSQARALARLLRRLPVKINLIPMNAVEGSRLRAPSFADTDAFREVLVDAGYSCFLRVRRGGDVAAACGQLALAGRLPLRSRVFGTSGETSA